jgi:hypothetical protein
VWDIPEQSRKVAKVSCFFIKDRLYGLNINFLSHHCFSHNALPKAYLLLKNGYYEVEVPAILALSFLRR